MIEKNKLENLVVILSKLEDPRIANKTDHKLVDIIFSTICAVISNCDTWEEIEDFTDDNIKWLRKYVALKNGAPSHDTFCRVFSIIDPTKFTKIFQEFTESIKIVKNTNSKELVVIDGKVIRGSADRLNNLKAIDVVSAWSADSKIVLAQVCTPDKSNEIKAIPKLLELLQLKDKIISIDAIGTQVDIAQQIIKNKGDYLLAVKLNQKTLFEDIQNKFKAILASPKEEPEVSFHETYDKDHGRFEHRQYYTTTDLTGFRDPKKWAGLKSIGMAKNIIEKNGKISTEIRYYISSHKSGANDFASNVRGHWSIENGLHWILDVVFNEDKLRSKIGDSPMNSSIIRHFVINLMKNFVTQKKMSTNRKRLKAGRSLEILEKIIFN